MNIHGKVSIRKKYGPRRSFWMPKPPKTMTKSFSNRAQIDPKCSRSAQEHPRDAQDASKRRPRAPTRRQNWNSIEDPQGGALPPPDPWQSGHLWWSSCLAGFWRFLAFLAPFMMSPKLGPRMLPKTFQKWAPGSKIEAWRLQNRGLEDPKSIQEPSKTPFFKDINLRRVKWSTEH